MAALADLSLSAICEGAFVSTLHLVSGLALEVIVVVPVVAIAMVAVVAVVAVVVVFGGVDEGGMFDWLLAGGLALVVIGEAEEAEALAPKLVLFAVVALFVELPQPTLAPLVAAEPVSPVCSSSRSTGCGLTGSIATSRVCAFCTSPGMTGSHLRPLARAAGVCAASLSAALNEDADAPVVLGAVVVGEALNAVVDAAVADKQRIISRVGRASVRVTVSFSFVGVENVLRAKYTGFKKGRCFSANSILNKS